MSHTAGPWRTELYQWDEAPCGVGQRLAVIRQPRGDVDIAYVPVDEDDGEMQDNESLIAAAPEMLDALREAYSAITYMMSNDDCGGAANALEAVVAAIAKAEGRE